MLKRLTMVLLAVLAIALFPGSDVSADTVKVFINTEEASLDQPPLIKNGRTLVPLRFISEHLGYKVKWDQKKKVVTIVFPKDDYTDYTVALPIGKRTATRTPSSYLHNFTKDDVETFVSDAPSQVINGRTVVPLRFVGELLDISVKWDSKNRDIYISTLGVNLIPSDFEKNVYDHDLRKVKGFGKPTVTYEKFLALDVDHFNPLDLDYLFARKPSLDLFGNPYSYRDRYNEIIIGGTRQNTMLIFKGRDLPILSYPDVTAENTTSITEGMTYEEVAAIFGGPGVLSGKGTLLEEYKWVSSTEKGEAYFTFAKKDGQLSVTDSPYRSYTWELNFGGGTPESNE